MSTSCPKCAHVRPANSSAPGWQCPRCEVACDKYREVVPPGPDSAAATRALPARRRAQTFSDCALIAAALSALLPVIKTAHGDSVSVVNALLLVPFYFMFTPLVAWIMLREAWYWDRYAFGFARYDLAARPITGSLMLIFNALASVIFAGLFFALQR